MERRPNSNYNQRKMLLLLLRRQRSCSSRSLTSGHSSSSSSKGNRVLSSSEFEKEEKKESKRELGKEWECLMRHYCQSLSSAKIPHEIFSPRLSPLALLLQKRRNVQQQGAKGKEMMLVSVNVEGSVGDVRMIVNKSDTVMDLIACTVRAYAREGRRPHLLPFKDMNTSFQLYLSVFTFQGLQKSERLGDIGSRTYFLRQERTLTFLEDADNKKGKKSDNDVIIPDPAAGAAFFPQNPLFASVVARQIRKIRTRTVKLWKTLDLLVCGTGG